MQVKSNSLLKMDIWGNFLKETTRLGYKRQIRKSQKLKDQNETLRELLTKAKLTEFGSQHRFKDILKGENLITSFTQNVPITNYNRFYDNWLNHTLNGRRNVIWPGKIGFYALSSGTTGAASKRIPVSDTMLRQFQKTTFKQIVGLHDLNLPSSFFESNVLVVGGSTNLTKIGAHLEGDLSGILAKNKSFVLTPFSKPNPKIAKIRDWNEKMDAIVENAKKWNIGVIAGVPSWVSMLLEKIITYHKVDTIHEIWPNLAVYTHGGVFIEPYRDKLNKLFGKPMVFQNTFLASEGYFAYQKNYQEDCLELLVNDGVYFEFVPQEYFEQLKNGDFDKIQTLNIDQVRTGTPYALIISTCAGLWRYYIGDVIEFTDAEAKKIKITGRVSYTLSVCGEHISEENMNQAIQFVNEQLGITVEEFCVYPNKSKDGHKWFIGTNFKVDSSKYAKLLDDFLKKNNDDYASLRKYTLKEPVVQALPVQKFYEFMESINKLGGQSKFPRVMSETQIEKWEGFLHGV